MSPAINLIEPRSRHQMMWQTTQPLLVHSCKPTIPLSVEFFLTSPQNIISQAQNICPHHSIKSLLHYHTSDKITNHDVSDRGHFGKLDKLEHRHQKRRSRRTFSNHDANRSLPGAVHYRRRDSPLCRHST